MLISKLAHCPPFACSVRAGGGGWRFLQTYYNEAEVRDMCRGLIESVRYCHELGIVHRDLRPEHLLLSSKGEDANIKLAEFGFACSVLNGNVTAKCGSPGYVSPEVLRGLPYGTVGALCAVNATKRPLIAYFV